MIRVYVVEDHAIVREGLSALLALSGEIAVDGMAGSAEEALAALKTVKPDLLLVDIKLPGMDGVGLIRTLRSQGNETPVLILTTFEDDTLLLEGLKAGARGYLLKDVSLVQLVDAIRTVANGGRFVSPATTERLLRGVLRTGAQPSVSGALDALTARETDVLRLMANGCSNAEIAELLDVREGTIKNHVSSILSKLGVRDRTRAVLKGVELGLV